MLVPRWSSRRSGLRGSALRYPFIACRNRPSVADRGIAVQHEAKFQPGEVRHIDSSGARPEPGVQRPHVRRPGRTTTPVALSRRVTLGDRAGSAAIERLLSLRPLTAGPAERGDEVLSIVGGRASAGPSDPDDLSGRGRFGERGNRAPDDLSAQPAPPVWRRLDPGAADHPGWMRAGWRIPTRIRHARRADERDDQGR